MACGAPALRRLEVQLWSIHIATSKTRLLSTSSPYICNTTCRQLQQCRGLRHRGNRQMALPHLSKPVQSQLQTHGDQLRAFWNELLHVHEAATSLYTDSVFNSTTAPEASSYIMTSTAITDDTAAVRCLRGNKPLIPCLATWRAILHKTKPILGCWLAPCVP